MPGLPSGTVTFLFTDIEGSTRLLKVLGDRYGDVLAQHERILRGLDGGGLAWSADYGDLWTNSFADGTVTRLHPATRRVQTVRSVAINPVVPIVDESGVWTGDWSRPQVVHLNAVGPAQPKHIRLPIQNKKLCPRVSCVWRLAAGAGYIWATTPEDRALWRIDPKTDKVTVTRISLPYSPAAVAADDDDVWVTVRGK
jgi:streptogramin lyase